MRVAVLMSTYNGEKYLQQQLDSILKQTGGFEVDIWVRDDGSTDNYAFADQDDYWLPGKIQAGINLIQNCMCPAMYCSNAELVNVQLLGIGRNVYRQAPRLDFHTLSCAGGILGCTIMFNNLLAKIIQKYALPKKIVMHDSYVAIICAAVEGKLVYDENVYLKYRQHDNNAIGVSYGFLKTVKERLDAIFKCPKVSIADQAKSVTDVIDNQISGEKLNWLISISKYKDTYGKRVYLAFSGKTKYINLNMAFKIRMSILFGNR